MLKILIAEDDLELRQLFQHVLMKSGYSVKGVSNGQEALDAMDKEFFNLIISDVMMPVMDGYEATRVIRASGHPRAGSIPILAMTADAFHEDVVKAREAGMNGHLAKPIDPDRLYQAIERFLRKM